MPEKSKTKKMLAYAMLPVLGLSLFGASAASAHGLMGGFMKNATPEEIALRQQTHFQEQADLLGVSIDDIKNAWAEGKNLKQLAEEKGISQETVQTKMKELHTQKMKTQLQTLVDKGVVTQAQADKRLATMQTMMDQKPMMKKMGRGFHF